MCGIVGYIGTQVAVPILIEGLSRLEYRGYDSAGLATVSQGDLHLVRAPGKLVNLREKLASLDSTARVGIAHTRWATHGKPEERNAHPHIDGHTRVAVVQNGIVENHRVLREHLEAAGCTFTSDTDTEVIPHLIAQHLAQSTLPRYMALLEAVRQTVNQLQGAFAIAVVAADYPDEIIVARQQAPLVVGFGQGEVFCASDTTALLSHTQAFLSLENGEMARLTPLGAEVYSFAGERLTRYPRTLDWSPALVEKQGFRHFMLKEIYEQPGVVRACLESHLIQEPTDGSPLCLGTVTELYPTIERIQIVACGTSWHAGLVGRHLLEQVAGIPTTVHYASEFRYSPPPLQPGTLTIGVTQSGETADTLAALEMEVHRCQVAWPGRPLAFLGITNRLESSLGRLLPHLIHTQAGIEIGVAATKTFAAQLVAFYLLAFDLAFQRGKLDRNALQDILNHLQQVPSQIEWILETQAEAIEHLAHEFRDVHNVVYLGRGINFPIALEGALKLKEISYIHAEGYPAGEMKHGPIALLDPQVPVVTLALPGSVFEKVLSNAQEAKARDARLIGVGPADDPHVHEVFHTLLPVPTLPELLSPLVAVVPLQLLAYYIAAHRGLDVDQPRNLAKSVTVE
ncbi:MAG: glutamine--fructose-6-phosphate transaminase (isomerizing) [Gloeomargaritaceae cyanobacterium C42_A2020_066]|nr:glutamine--fructose-6-phosphate transaminase (isomerizing) [Gloeomargaritaceae cyanobacterium C42_A2020_066]